MLTFAAQIKKIRLNILYLVKRFKRFKRAWGIPQKLVRKSRVRTCSTYMVGETCIEEDFILHETGRWLGRGCNPKKRLVVFCSPTALAKLWRPQRTHCSQWLRQKSIFPAQYLVGIVPHAVSAREEMSDTSQESSLPSPNNEQNSWNCLCLCGYSNVHTPLKPCSSVSWGKLTFS